MALFSSLYSGSVDLTLNYMTGYISTLNENTKPTCGSKSQMINNSKTLMYNRKWGGVGTKRNGSKIIEQIKSLANKEIEISIDHIT